MTRKEHHSGILCQEKIVKGFRGLSHASLDKAGGDYFAAVTSVDDHGRFAVAGPFKVDRDFPAQNLAHLVFIVRPGPGKTDATGYQERQQERQPDNPALPSAPRFPWRLLPWRPSRSRLPLTGVPLRFPGSLLFAFSERAPARRGVIS